MNPWDEEYRRQGIPSSHRHDPSGTVVWGLTNYKLLHDGEGPRTAVDVGCGAARNSIYLAQEGARVWAFDGSAHAVNQARENIRHASASVEVTHRDLRDSFEFCAGGVDLVIDIFVFKHVMERRTRHDYLERVASSLSPDGCFLLSLAHEEDGYYGNCPAYAGPEEPHGRIVWDPVAKVGSVLFTLESLTAELSHAFTLEMLWRKRKLGVMHGERWLRDTFATLWRPKPKP